MYSDHMDVNAISEPKVIYEDKDIIVLNKPAGLMVHGVKLGSRVSVLPMGRNTRTPTPIPDTRTVRYPIPESTLVDWLLFRYPQ